MTIPGAAAHFVFIISIVGAAVLAWLDVIWDHRRSAQASDSNATVSVRRDTS